MSSYLPKGDETTELVAQTSSASENFAKTLQVNQHVSPVAFSTTDGLRLFRIFRYQKVLADAEKLFETIVGSCNTPEGKSAIASVLAFENGKAVQNLSSCDLFNEITIAARQHPDYDFAMEEWDSVLAGSMQRIMDIAAHNPRAGLAAAYCLYVFYGTVLKGYLFDTAVALHLNVVNSDYWLMNTDANIYLNINQILSGFTAEAQIPHPSQDLHSSVCRIVRLMDSALRHAFFLEPAASISYAQAWQKNTEAAHFVTA